MDEYPTFFSMDPDLTPDPTFNRNEEKIYLYFRLVGIKVDLINHHLKLEFVNSGLYFVPR